jgi:poly(A) polymerase
MPDPIRRLASLIEADPSGVAEVTDALKLSKNQHKQLTNIKKNITAIYWDMPYNTLQRAIFRLGITTVIDLALHNWANMLKSSPKNTKEIEDGWLQIISTTQEQKGHELILPIKGQDVLDLGILPSYQISELLNQVEEWWLEKSCTPDRKACLRKLKSLVNFPSDRIEKSEIKK